MARACVGLYTGKNLKALVVPDTPQQGLLALMCPDFPSEHLHIPDKLEGWNPAWLCGGQIFISDKLQIRVQEASLRGDNHTLKTN